jgi:ketosteroid isomerase-like protein
MGVEMKSRIFAISVLMTALFLSLVAAAGAVTPVYAPRVVALKMLEAHNKAFTARDLSAIMALYAPDAVVIDSSAPGIFIGRAAIRNWFKTIFLQPGQTRGVYQLLAAGRTGRAVWFASKLTSSRVDRGRTIIGRLYLTGVLVKKAGAWRVAQIHVSLMPKAGH